MAASELYTKVSPSDRSCRCTSPGNVKNRRLLLFVCLFVCFRVALKYAVAFLSDVGLVFLSGGG